MRHLFIEGVSNVVLCNGHGALQCFPAQENLLIRFFVFFLWIFVAITDTGTNLSHKPSMKFHFNYNKIHCNKSMWYNQNITLKTVRLSTNNPIFFAHGLITRLCTLCRVLFLTYYSFIWERS